MDKIKVIKIEDEMKQSYIDYSMSVIVGRALPDAKDGLKPVHRRILYAMNEMGLVFNKSFKKSARVVGEVLGKFHPHGDTAVYDSMVRMAQAFSLRYPLVKGQGNFGSVDGDPAAAMRYTEAKLAKISSEMLKDIEKNTVNFADNFDGSMKEPVVLPSMVPNLLVNGSSGIAVGMATNMPPHNLSEICSAVIAVVDDIEIEYNDLIKYVSAPDFPTGGIICGTVGVRQAYKNGRGKVITRAKTHLEKNKIIVTELPYMVNKARLLENTAELVKDKRIEGINMLRDESDRTGMRMVIGLKQDANPEVVLNLLYKHTSMQTTFGVINLALVNGEPKVLSLKDLLLEFIRHRKEVIVRRTQFDLDKAKEKAHLLEGIIIALENIDSVIKSIKGSADAKAAKQTLVDDYSLSELQAQAILDIKLQRLTSMEQGKIREEHKNLLAFITECQAILGSEDRIKEILKKEMVYLIETYGGDRRTAIEDVELELETEDLIEEEDVVVTMTNSGYVKRIPLETYKSQRRGGKGIKAAGTREEDFVKDLFITSTHNYLMFFTDKGKVYWLKGFNIPEAGRYAKGTAIINLLKLEKGEEIKAVIPVAEFSEDKYLMFVTRKGIAKKTSLKEYSNVRNGGIIAVNLREDDDLVNVVLTSDGEEILIATKDGRAVRFKGSDVGAVGRNSIGVKGINVKNSEVVDVIVCNSPHVLTVTEKGYGKRSPVEDYRLINRGGSGVINIKITEKNGKVCGITCVGDGEEVMFLTRNGLLVRTPIKDISVIGRNTQGVRVIRLGDGDSLIGLAKVAEGED